MKNYFVLLSFLTFCLATYSQDTPQKKSAHYFGIHAGTTTAYGLSYRYWPKRFGIEFTTLPTFKKINPLDKKMINSKISTGLSVLFKIKESKVVDLFTYVGGFSLFEKHHESYYIQDTHTTEYLKKEKLDINIGLGLGARFKFLEVLDFNLQLGYGIYKINQANNLYSLVTGEVGLYYNF